MDESFIERAEELERAEREEALRKAARACAPEFHQFFDGKHCIEDDCGEEIPPGRLALGKIRCVTCQWIKERK